MHSPELVHRDALPPGGLAGRCAQLHEVLPGCGDRLDELHDQALRCCLLLGCQLCELGRPLPIWRGVRGQGTSDQARRPRV